MMSKMLRSATYWTSGPEDSSVTKGTPTISPRNPRKSHRVTQWRTHLLADVVDESSILHVIHEIQENFDGGQDHS